jgi:hypothetical protein
MLGIAYSFKRALDWNQCLQLTVPCRLQLLILVFIATPKRKQALFSK